MVGTPCCREEQFYGTIQSSLHACTRLRKYCVWWHATEKFCLSDPHQLTPLQDLQSWNRGDI